MAKLSEKTKDALVYLQSVGGKATTVEMMDALGCEKIASVTGRVNSLVKKELAVREKQEVGEGTVTYVILTDAGKQFDAEADAE